MGLNCNNEHCIASNTFIYDRIIYFHLWELGSDACERSIIRPRDEALKYIPAALLGKGGKKIR